MNDAELPEVLSLLAASGATPRTAETWAHDRMTAVVLGEPAIAAMPMAVRTIASAPGRPLTVGWLSSNQFASRMSLRGRTRQTARDWPALLPELDALLVLRREETSLAARWYAQTGYHDILSVRCLYLDMESPPHTPGMRAGGTRYAVQVATPSDPAWKSEQDRWQAEMAAVYHEVYSAYGGPPARSVDFWTPALAYHYYREHYQFQILGLWSSGAPAQHSLLGYAVVGWSGWHSKRPRMDILELATRQWDTGIAADLILTTCQLAWSKNVRQVRAVVSTHDPYRGHLTRTGFEDRWGYQMMAHWLNPQRHLDRLAAALPAEIGGEGLTLQLSAAGGEMPPLTLRTKAGRGTPQTLSLTATPPSLTRLLLNRLDITAALQEGTLMPTNAADRHEEAAGQGLTDHHLAQVSLAFPWTPWAFHMLDYI
jgi:hypothetical protein